MNFILTTCCALIIAFLMASSVATANSEMIPDAVIYPGDRPGHIMVVDKAEQFFYLYSHNGQGKVTLEKVMSCSTGENKGDKLVEGDKKTPNGFYVFNKKHLPRELPPIYGTLAYPMDYPNFWDKAIGRGGYGIWTHGINKPLTDYDSNGCVELENADIAQMEEIFKLFDTPILVYEKLEFAPVEQLETERQAIFNFLEEWRRAWSEKDHEVYQSLYDPKFINSDGRSFKNWMTHKEQVGKRYEKIFVALKDLRIYRHRDVLVAVFEQDYRGDSRFTSKGEKRLYFKEDGDSYKILAEEFKPLPNRETKKWLTAAEKRHALETPSLTAQAKTPPTSVWPTARGTQVAEASAPATPSTPKVAAATRPSAPTAGEEQPSIFASRVSKPHIHSIAESIQTAENQNQAQAELLAKQQAETEARAQAELLAKQQAEAEARAQAELLAKQQAEAEARAQAELLAKQQAEAEARAQAELLAKQQAEAEARAQAELLAKQQAEAEARAQAELLAQIKAETEARERKAQAELQAQLQAQQQAEAEARERLEAEKQARELAEAEARRLEEQSLQYAEEMSRQLEEDKIKETLVASAALREKAGIEAKARAQKGDITLTEDETKALAEVEARQRAATEMRESVEANSPSASQMASEQVSTSQKEAIVETLKQWATAWSGRHLNDYFALYHPDFLFVDKNMKLTAFKRYRTTLIKRAKAIEIGISDIKFKEAEGDIELEFKQNYKADTYSDVGYKTLHFRQTPDGWKIVREAWRPL